MSLDVDLTPLVEILDDGDATARCQVHICFTLIGRNWSRTWERTCRRKAKAVVIVSCLMHGSIRQGICRPHLALLKRSPDNLKCADCGLPALWRLA